MMFLTNLPLRPIVLAAALLLPGCVTPAAPDPGDGIVRARLGQTVDVGGPKVTPLAVREDSRCPMNARCVWAGQVRLAIRVELGSGRSEHEIVTGKPVPIADGTLELVEVQPDRVAGEKPFDNRAYRFGFTFAGSL